MEVKLANIQYANIFRSHQFDNDISQGKLDCMMEMGFAVTPSLELTDECVGEVPRELELGLSSAEVEKRKQIYGWNNLEKQEGHINI
ncbi:hypothetical protein V6N13_144537 [Hibiscus sabdariffa]|uniref:Cation-transporting P-type ATPase N-terminal domain-containing protein n=1 Tax=Hibiscus sabdariffa TaxID=183260 RepID=A0ABR2FKP5_9ROSI